MKTKLILYFFISFSITSYSQTSNANNSALQIEIKKQANEMGDAFIKGDYKSFVKFTYPKLIQLMGGESKMIATLTKTINDTKSQGVSFLGVTFDNPTKIIKVKNELQCTIVQHLAAHVPNGNTTSSSTLIGISLDNGKKWYFIDSTNKTNAQMKQLLPNLSPEIILPKKN
ncbi:MAG: hypothetical protein ABI426_04260 [Flavobacterium sp.]